MSTPRPRVVGLDLSLTGTGLVTTTARGDTLIQVVSTTKLEGLPRLRKITDVIVEAITDGPPMDLAVVEGPAYSRALGAGHHESAGLWWKVVDRLDELGIPTGIVPPNVLKKYATGTGTASKPDMRLELYKRTGMDVRNDNKVDALWLHAMGADHLGRPHLVLPQKHREALGSVAWPILPEAVTP